MQTFNFRQYLKFMGDCTANQVEVVALICPGAARDPGTAVADTDPSVSTGTISGDQQRFFRIAGDQDTPIQGQVKVLDIKQDGKPHVESPFMDPAEIDDWIAGQR